MDSAEEDTAFEMFSVVHGRLGHHFDESYFNMLPAIKRMWIEVVRFTADNTACHDANAYEMYCIVHARIGDGRNISLAEFESIMNLRRAWLVIADEVRARARRRAPPNEV